MVPWLAFDDPFPPVERALGVASGAPSLLAASADLLPSRLTDAYQRGIFPWYWTASRCCGGVPTRAWC